MHEQNEIDHYYSCVQLYLEYFAGEKLLRMSQISRNLDPLRSNYCVLARIVCIYQLGFAILLLRIDQPSQSSQMFDARKTFFGEFGWAKLLPVGVMITRKKLSNNSIFGECNLFPFLVELYTQLELTIHIILGSIYVDRVQWSNCRVNKPCKAELE